MSNIQTKANEIFKMLIDSGLSLEDQLIVLKMVREKIHFCRNIGHQVDLKLK